MTDLSYLPVGPIFCFGDNADAERVRLSQRDTTSWYDENFGLIGNDTGYRLLSMAYPNDGSVPQIVYNIFRWCGLGAVTRTTPIASLIIPGSPPRAVDRYVFRVSPADTRGVYVADHGPCTRRPTPPYDVLKPLDILLRPDRLLVERARARTIVSASDYTGGFEQPVVLINRALEPDEIELVSGPWPRKSECDDRPLGRARRYRWK